ncbi:MAG: 5'-nucleotidase C-terminal domain-containing protein, partial [Gemmatimonadaceae bacterium]|nr:5'-nucleotidase C-terminal domain-containing protein [Gemmatimonadaceae bacterium]
MRSRPPILLAATFAAAILAGCASLPAGAPATADVVIAATTDVHGRLRAWDYYANAADPARGLTRAATIVDSLRTAHPGQVVLVDAGDLLQGNPMTYVAARLAADQPHPVAAAMNVMRYDAAAVGNHEFNYGLPLLEKAIGEANFPFLAANAYRVDGTRAYRAWHIVERQGARVAIVGATNPGSMIWDRDNLSGRLVIRDIVPEVRTAVAEARAAGADVVVTVLHSGLDSPSSYDTVTTGLPSENVSARVAREIPGIDVLVVGHSHQEVADTTINGVLVIQPKNWATSVSVAHLALVRSGGRWHVSAKRAGLVQAHGHAEHQGVVAATAAMHDRTVAYVTAPIGTTAMQWRSDSARLIDTPIVDFTLEVMRRAANAELASTAAFSTDASFGPGPITVAQVAALYPYENTLRAIRITGRQLRDYLEFSSRYYRQTPDGRPDPDPGVPGYNFDIVAGVEYAYDLSKPAGQRLTHLTRNGRPVADGETFTFALNNYRQTGGGGYAMLSGAPVVYESTDGIREMLIEEVRNRGTLRPEMYFVRNWGIVGVGGVSSKPWPAATPLPPAPAVPVVKDPAPAQRITARTLRIISTNDFHGALEPIPDLRGYLRGGAAAVAGVIDEARRACVPPACQSLLLDGGDMFTGTPISNFAHGRPVVDVYNTLDYAAAALGNHEFDWGQDTLRARMRQARHAFLGANVRYEDGTDVPWIRNDT